MSSSRRKRAVFVWENFGPIHADRCEALALDLRDEWDVVGVELGARSGVYDWDAVGGSHFLKETLFSGTIAEVSFLRRLFATVGSCLRHSGDIYFLCHYEELATFVLAMILRTLGRPVVVMNDSKFDDRQRSFWRECVKRVFYWPYSAGLAGSERARDYMRFLGVPEKRIALNYCALSFERLRRLADAPLAPDGQAFKGRHFTIVARFVPKKNLEMALRAYAIYRAKAARPRPLHLCGSGPLEGALRVRVNELGLDADVVFRGFVQTDEVCRTLAQTLALILPSVEEQFGNVVTEAQALNVPVILSENCGARDPLVRSGVNGFVIEPDNPEGLAFFMQLLADDEALWRRMCHAAPAFSYRADVAEFVRSVRQLIASFEGGGSCQAVRN
jgi:L-malate glycosyltransferase